MNIQDYYQHLIQHNSCLTCNSQIYSNHIEYEEFQIDCLCCQYKLYIYSEGRQGFWLLIKPFIVDFYSPSRIDLHIRYSDRCDKKIKLTNLDLDFSDFVSIKQKIQTINNFL